MSVTVIKFNDIGYVRIHLFTGYCKTWTLDSGLDRGLDYGLDS